MTQRQVEYFANPGKGNTDAVLAVIDAYLHATSDAVPVIPLSLAWRWVWLCVVFDSEWPSN